MLIRVFFLIVICFDFCFDTLYAQDPCRVKNGSTAHGEVLNYKVYYTLAGAYLGAGEAVFSNKLESLQQTPVWHVTGNGRTYPSYDWFFRVRDTYESFIDTATMTPRKFVRRVQEGSTRIYNQVLFDLAKGKAVSTHGVFAVSDCIQDVLSVIYFARNLDFSRFVPGQKINLNLFLDDQTWPIYIRYLGKEKLKTMYGEYQTIKFRPMLIEGTIFRGGEKMEVWVTDDNNRLPVFIHTPILVGSIKVYLTSFSGLKNAPSGILQRVKS